MENSHHSSPEFHAGRAYQLAIIVTLIDKWHAEEKLSGSATHFLVGELLAMLDEMNGHPKDTA